MRTDFRFWILDAAYALFLFFWYGWIDSRRKINSRIYVKRRCLQYYRFLYFSTCRVDRCGFSIAPLSHLLWERRKCVNGVYILISSKRCQLLSSLRFVSHQVHYGALNNSPIRTRWTASLVKTKRWLESYSNELFRVLTCPDVKVQTIWHMDENENATEVVEFVRMPPTCS